MRRLDAEVSAEGDSRRGPGATGTLFGEVPRGGTDLGALRSLAGMGAPRADGGMTGLLPRREPPALGRHDGAEWEGDRRLPPRRSPPDVATVPPLQDAHGAAPAGTGLNADVLALLRGQAALLAHLAGGPPQAAMGSSPLLAGAPPGFHGSPLPNDPLRAGAGVKGIEALEQLNQDFESRPRAYSEAIRGNAARPMREPGAPERGAVMTNFCSRWLPWGTQGGKDKIYLTYGICHALDLMHLGQWELAEGLLHLLVASIEAVCHDHGRWQMAWLLTFLPEPPWAQMASAPAWDAVRPFGLLAPVSMTTAATHYLKDVAALGELRRAKTRYPQAQQAERAETGGEAGEEGAAAGGRGRGRRR